MTVPSSLVSLRAVSSTTLTTAVGSAIGVVTPDGGTLVLGVEVPDAKPGAGTSPSGFAR